MQYFDRNGKHNFVDENNVFVGYDNDQCCCEHAGWYLDDEVPAKVDRSRSGSPDGFAWDRYRFDSSYFSEIHDVDGLDSGSAVAFKIVASGLQDKYIILFNAHNGYYGHGFEVKHGGQVLRSGTL